LSTMGMILIPKSAASYRRKNQSKMFSSRVRTILIMMPVARGKWNENPGRSTLISPGRLPNGSPILPATQTMTPTATTPRPRKTIHLPSAERSIMKRQSFTAEIAENAKNSFFSAISAHSAVRVLAVFYPSTRASATRSETNLTSRSIS
jgi:hypothetical protein